jgi:peptidoglycan hydrolase-like protein with peptidoglycan-binding domain
MAAACSADFVDAPADEDGSARPGSASLKRGDTGPEVAEAVGYFSRYGYFENDALRVAYPAWRAIVGKAPVNDRVFGVELERAVRAFQAKYSLPVTGEIDEATRGMMAAPRCGVPDSLRHSGVDKWGPNSNGWRADHSVTYSVAAIPATFQGPAGTTWTQAEVDNHVNTAFRTWGRDAAIGAIPSTPSDLTFQKVSSGADVRVIFCNANGDTGCSSPNFFAADGTGPLADASASVIRVSTKRNWDKLTTTDGVDFVSVMLHEMGHSLGIAHSNASDGTTRAVMYPFLSGTVAALRQDDYHALAASPYTNWRSVTGAATDIGASVVGTAEHVWILGDSSSLPEGFRVYKWNELSASFGVVNGTGGVRIDVKGSEPWIITNTGLAKSYNGSAWQNRGDCNFVDIGASPTDVWALGTPASGGEYTLYRYNNATGTTCTGWVAVTDGVRGRWVDVAPGTNAPPWVVTSTGTIHRRNGVTSLTGSNPAGTGWSTFGGLANDISIGAQAWGTYGAMWITGHPSQTDDIFIFNFQAGLDSNGDGDFDDGSDAPSRNQWARTPDGDAVTVTAGLNGMPWVLASNHSIWRRKP